MIKIFLYLIMFVPFLFSQQRDSLTIDEQTGDPMLLGYISRDVLSDSTFSWFDDEYNFYETDKSFIEIIEENLNGINIVVVMGTWCSESIMFVPRLFKILDEVNFSEEKIKTIGVNREKKSDILIEEGIDIEFVPTIIFYKDNEELGRIVEFPEETVEEDMALILR